MPHATSRTPLQKLGDFFWLLMSGIFVYGLTGMIAFFAVLTFSLQTLAQKEADDALLFYLLTGLTLIHLFILVLLVRKKMWWGFTGLALTLCFPVYGYREVGPEYFSRFRYEPFDAAVWREFSPGPLAAAKTLVKDSTLMGLPKAEVVKTLGEGESSMWGETEDALSWRLEDGWLLEVRFRQDTAREAVILMPGWD